MGEKRGFYGKWIILGSLMITVFTMAIINNTTSFYMTPVCEQFGFSIASFSICYSFAAIGAAAGAIVAGILINKLPLRLMMTLGIILTAACFAGLSIATQLWQFYILLCFADFGMGLASNIPLTTMLSNWYVDKRGTMTGVVFAGMGVGGVIFSILVEKWILNLSWQSATVISGVIILIIALPVCLFLFYKKPEDIGQTAFVYPEGSGKKHEKAAEEKKDAVQADDDGVSKGEALRSPVFYILSAGLLCLGLIAAGVMVHVPNFLYEIGMNAGVTMAILSAVAIVGTFVSGVIFDKLGPVKGMLVAAGAFILGMICLYCATQIQWLVYLMALFVGFSICIGTTGPPLLTSAVFGTKDYSSLFGILYALFLVGCMAGPVFSGAIFDLSGNYGPVWLIFIAVAAVMFLFCAWAVASGRKLRHKLASAKEHTA